MRLHWPSPNRSIGTVDALGITGVVGLLVARFIPVARLPFWGCALRKATGIPCLGCGLTRVADRVAHGNLVGAWSANPLGTVAALGFAFAALLCLLHLAFRAPLPRVEVTPREMTWLRVAGVAAVVTNYAFILIKAKFPGILA